MSSGAGLYIHFRDLRQQDPAEGSLCDVSRNAAIYAAMAIAASNPLCSYPLNHLFPWQSRNTVDKGLSERLGPCLIG